MVVVVVGVLGAAATAATAIRRFGGSTSAAETGQSLVSSPVEKPRATTTTSMVTPSLALPADPPSTSAPPPSSPQLAAPPLAAPWGTSASGVPRCRPISQMSVEQLAHLLQMVGISGAAIGPARLLAIGDAPVGGLFIGGDDTQILIGGSLRELVDQTAVIVAVDEEGGRVQRIDGLVGPLPAAAEMGAMPNSTVRSLGEARGRQMRARGVTVDFAPVVDVAAPAGGVIGDRSFGVDPVTVTERAAAFADGLRSAGVVPTLKHFPGHGATLGDSHKEVVKTDPLEVLQRRDLLPYATLAGPNAPAVWVMMGHLDVPGLTEPNLPASLSPAAHRYLRDTIGFKGLIVSDELGGMRSVAGRYDVGRAAVLALSAGTDLLLFADVADLARATRSIIAAVQQGSVSLSRLQDAAEHVQEASGC